MRRGELQSKIPVVALLFLMLAGWIAIRTFPQPPASP
jgi:hypothetical protein